MPESYQGSHQQYDAICQSNIMIPMRDGVHLATDIYLPALGGQPASGKFPVILERTPYDKAASGNVTNGNYYARRGYVCAIQDVRGRFASDGDWYPFAKEAPMATIQWNGSPPRSGVMDRWARWVGPIAAATSPH